MNDRMQVFHFLRMRFPSAVNRDMRQSEFRPAVEMIIGSFAQEAAISKRAKIILGGIQT
jgi:hypothetical protein